MHDREDGCLVQIGLAVLLIGLASMVAYEAGRKQGVRDHAAGRYVVVPMPDGTEQVCEVKEPK